MAAQPWNTISASTADIRLVVCDMDGTLLDSRSEFPPRFWDLLDELHRRDIEFVPASGRQLARLTSMFESRADHMSFVAENGTLVMNHGTPIQMKTLTPDIVNAVLSTVSSHRDSHRVYPVVCGYRSAYINSSTPQFHTEAEKYYAALQMIDDLSSYDDEVLKIALYDLDDAEESAYPLFEPFSDTHQVVLAGQHWVDIMDMSATKGTGIDALQTKLGITPDQTVVFGDYLNDLEMYSYATWSFAVSNAHPTIIDTAHYLAPSNDEAGVVTVLEHLLGISH